MTKQNKINDENEVRDEASHANFAIIQKVIGFLLTDPNHYRVYCELKQICGEGGNCTFSNKHLAERCHLSERTVFYAKKRMSQKFDQIGQPLIKIEKRLCKSQKMTSLITLLDTWQFNTKCSLKKMKLKESFHLHIVQEGTAQYADKEEPIKKNIGKKENNKRKKAAPEKPSVPKEGVAPPETPAVVVSLLEEMKEVGISDRVAIKLVEKYEPDIIRNSIIVLKASSVRCIDAFMRKACADRFNPQKPDRGQINRQKTESILAHSIKSKPNDVKLEIKSSGLYFIVPGNGEPQKASFKSEDFDAELKALFKKYRVILRDDADKAQDEP